MNVRTMESPPPVRHHVCPWWLGYFFDNPLRRRIHPPEKVLGPYVKKGMTVLDFGCGFGHFSLGMARLTGPSGRVVAADVQDKMLEKTRSRARKAGLDGIIRPLRCTGNGISGVAELDFALASNSLHETPNPQAVLAQLLGALKPGACLLLMEPAAHLKAKDFEAEILLAKEAGFQELHRPKALREHCALLQKPEERLAK